MAPPSAQGLGRTRSRSGRLEGFTSSARYLRGRHCKTCQSWGYVITYDLVIYPRYANLGTREANGQSGCPFLRVTEPTLIGNKHHHDTPPLESFVCPPFI